MRNATAKRDNRWLVRAAKVAARGLGATYPNPCVGAVVVRGDQELAAAHSAATGGQHAEVRALARAGTRSKGATLYVTLEPCRHHGRTPPCVGAIIDAGIRRVVVGVIDPAAHVRGKGVRALRRGGVDVLVSNHVASQAVHEHYLHQVTNHRPFVTLKSATSLDGRIATGAGDSRWITGEAARRVGHRLRARHHAIAVGVDTALADDPRLDVRLCRGVDPQRVVFDSRLRMGRTKAPPQLVAPGTIILHAGTGSARAHRRLEERGAELLAIDADAKGRVQLDAALLALASRDVRSLLVEGGGSLVGSFVAENAWDRWFWFQAPRVLGEGTAAVRGYAPATVAEAGVLHVERRQRVGDDWLTVLVRAPS